VGRRRRHVFIDGEVRPHRGTGSEDYFLGAWDFGGHPFFYRLYGAPVVGENAGRQIVVYRFHLDSPILYKVAACHHRTWPRQITARTISIPAYWINPSRTPVSVLPSVEQRFRVLSQSEAQAMQPWFILIDGAPGTNLYSCSAGLTRILIRVRKTSPSRAGI